MADQALSRIASAIAHRHIAALIARAVLGHDRRVMFEAELLVQVDGRRTLVVGEQIKLGRAQFLRPGDVHIHFFGTATLSFADGIATAPGDVFEIEAPGFGLPLRNPLVVTPGETAALAVKAL